MTNLFSYAIIPAVIEELVTPLGENHDESVLTFLGKGMLHLSTATIPLFREIVHAGMTGHNPAFGMMGTAMKPVVDVWRDLDRSPESFRPYRLGQTLQHMVTLMAISTGIGNQQAGRWLRAWTNITFGVERPQTADDWVKMFRYGTLREPRRR